MFDRASPWREYAAEEPFRAAGIDVTPVRLPHYRLETYGFRLAANGKTIAYSGDSGPSERLPSSTHDSDLFVCEATLSERRATTAFPAATSASRRRLPRQPPRNAPPPPHPSSGRAARAGRDRARLRRSGARAVAFRDRGAMSFLRPAQPPAVGDEEPAGNRTTARKKPIGTSTHQAGSPSWPFTFFSAACTAAWCSSSTSAAETPFGTHE